MPREVVQSLSPREDEILRLATDGFTDSAIAHKLGISEGTVGTYWGRIRTKLGPFPRTELVAIRIRAELSLKVDELTAERERLLSQIQSLEDSEHLYEHILDDSDEGVLLLAADGGILHANPAAQRIFGYTADELADKGLADLIPSRFRVQHRQHFSSFFTEPGHRRMNPHSPTFGLHRSGQEIALNITLSSAERDGSTVATCFVHSGTTHMS